MKRTQIAISSIVTLTLSALVISCENKKTDTQGKTTTDTLALKYTVITSMPHDPEAFTEGLVIHNSKILESTGERESWIGEINPGSGEPTKKVTLDDNYFGEGITVLNNKIYQLTWTTKIGFIYDAVTYKKIGDFHYNTQGWGITHNNHHLIMSDGSEKVYFLDTTSLKVDHTITVREGNNPIKQINELEYVNGALYANVWQTPTILKINPATGKVIGKLDLSQITNEVSTMSPHADVLNGIAYDVNSNAFLVTGKFWPRSYLIKVR